MKKKEDFWIILFNLNYRKNHLKKKKFYFHFNPLSASPTKWSNTVKQFVDKLLTNCLRVFDDFLKLAIKGLRKCFNFPLFFSLTVILAIHMLKSKIGRKTESWDYIANQERLLYPPPMKLLWSLLIKNLLQRKDSVFILRWVIFLM